MLVLRLCIIIYFFFVWMVVTDLWLQVYVGHFFFAKKWPNSLSNIYTLNYPIDEKLTGASLPI